ncbi:hypothetical protein KUCAC02_011348, partial [Chaenocephalus aceratus]
SNTSTPFPPPSVYGHHPIPIFCYPAPYPLYLKPPLSIAFLGAEGQWRDTGPNDFGPLEQLENTE